MSGSSLTSFLAPNPDVYSEQRHVIASAVKPPYSATTFCSLCDCAPVWRTIALDEGRHLCWLFAPKHVR